MPRRKGLRRILDDLWWSWKFFSASRQFDVVVTGWERSALFFLAWQRLLRFRPKPHLIVYSLWNLPHSPLARALKRAQFRFVAHGASAIVCYSFRQKELYSRTYGIPPQKFVCVPYYTTSRGVDLTVADGDYLFAGGDFTRDYRSLIEAVRGLPCRLIIAARYRHYFEGVDIPENVDVRTVTHDEFMRLMAGAKAVVVPLVPGLLQSGGQQTYLNAMAMGKPVLVADDCGADEYIEQSVTGIVLTPRDVLAMREAIRRLYDDPAAANKMGFRARDAARAYSPERFFRRILSLAARLSTGCPAA